MPVCGPCSNRRKADNSPVVSGYFPDAFRHVPIFRAFMKSDFPKLRVLAVDDNRTNLHILSVFLKKLGHEVILAENGQDALERFAEQKPDIILLDIMMPILDGFEVARRIKAECADYWVPIIFLSALNRDENLVEGLEAGGDDYLTKPVNFVVLEAKMRSMQRALVLQQRSIESLKRMQAISDNVLEAIITIDAGNRIVACNAAAVRLFGWSADELVGQDVGILIPEPHRSQHAQYVRNYLAGGPAHVIGMEREVEAVRRDGSQFQAELGITEIRLENSRLFIGVVRDITERKRIERKLQENARQLQTYYDHTRSEQALAMSLMEKQLHRRGLQDPRLRYTVLPAEHFSGDIVAATRSASGRLYVLLADATGHGLPAAVSVLPILALFYRMATRDRSVAHIIEELNLQLRESVPVGRFVAVSLVCLNEAERRGEIWVGGTPEALLIDHQGDIRLRFSSVQLPLGIVDNDTLVSQAEVFTWTPDSQLLLHSDGLIEAAGADGRPFGETRLQNCIARTTPDQRFDAILGAFGHHLDGQPAGDDVSIMLVDCV